MKTMFILCFLVSHSFAQYLLPVDSVNCRDAYNAEWSDFHYAVMPSPERESGYYRIDFDLGREYTDKDTITISVSGIIPEWSDIKICQSWNEGSETGLGHFNVIGKIQAITFGSLTHRIEAKYATYRYRGTYEHPYRFISLVRQSTCSGTQPAGSKLKVLCDPQNGEDALIDAVAIFQYTTPKIKPRIVYMHGIGKVNLRDGGKFVVR